MKRRTNYGSDVCRLKELPKIVEMTGDHTGSPLQKNKGLINTNNKIQVSVITKELSADTALSEVYQLIDNFKGAVFSSGFDYPGRHSRWDIGFVNPAIEIISRRNNFYINALNEQGQALLSLISPLISDHPHVAKFSSNRDGITGTLKPRAKFIPEEKRSREPSIFSIIRSLNSLFTGSGELGSHLGLYGAFGYDLVTQFEDIELRLPRSAEQEDCHLFLPLEIIVVDRRKEIATKFQYSITTPLGETADLKGGGEKFTGNIKNSNNPAEIHCDHQAGEFAKKVSEVINGTKRGDYFEVVLSQSFSRPYNGSPSELFIRLARINPSPYLFFINFGKEQLIGSSPEIYARVTDRIYETCPIAGTVRRGETPLEDADRVRELIASEKFESELTMCTDVDRNDMARVCEPGSVKIIGRRQLEFYSHLIHTVDHLQGTLREEFDALDAFQTHMWACTVTGAPKPAALQAIENLEASPRGWYSGAVGFLSFQGNLNTGITLRSAQIKDGIATVRAGATILFGSSPEEEEQETRTKAAAFLRALAEESAEKAAENATQIKKTPPSTNFKNSKILLVDCRDSFVHNLASYIRELGAEVVTLRSGFPLELINEIRPNLVFLSPGPGTPKEFGIPSLVGNLVEMKLPIFGVCLGHQGIGEHFGATLAELPLPEHGKRSSITHNNNFLFKDVPSPFEAGRYHSLYLLRDTVPSTLEVCAQTSRICSDGRSEVIPMAFAHKTLPIASVQFHPESLMTLKNRAGHLILRNALTSLLR